MSRGYIAIAQNNEEHDYLKMAYAMALSLKATQKENQFCVCVDENTKLAMKDKYKEVFDYVVDIPWNDDAGNDKWKIHNKWKYPHMSPFKESIILDTDMVFTHSVDHWWDYLSKKDMWVCTNVKTFRNEDVVDDYYRKKFTQLELPNVYSNFTYFKESETTFEFFRMVEIIMTHWNVYYDKFMKGTGQNWMSADLAYALAVRLLDLENEVCDYDIKDVPTFVHMKSFVQNIPQHKISSVWTQSLTSQLSDDLKVRVANYEQSLPFHYVEKDWMTDKKIQQYEKVLGL
jgi:hypothetical protein|tara:strand:+ start:342 stop:1202 length:861 start_codon:yes stop_codon:yes gene_type:complete